MSNAETAPPLAQGQLSGEAHFNRIRQVCERIGFSLALGLGGVVVPDVLSSPEPTIAAESPQAVVGMPFTGKWAYGQIVSPDANGNYNDITSSHPSAHHNYYGDWATDLYATAGTDVRLHVSSGDGPVTFSLNRLTDTCASAGPGVGGRGIVLNVMVNNAIIGSVDYEHLDNIPSGPYADGMVIGNITSESFDPNCYSARHAHIELKNSGTDTNACWVDKGNPGAEVGENGAIGVIGSPNTGDRQRCGDIPPDDGLIPYASIADGEEFYSEEGWVYTRAGGAAFPIEHKNNWTASDTAHWGNELDGPVSTAEVHDHEAGYTSAGRTVGAHPPANGTAIFLDSTGEQYYFYNGKAYPIGPGEVDDLGVRDKALRISGGRLWDFTNQQLTLNNGEVYRFAGNPTVRQLIYVGASALSYYVNNDTVKDCLRLTQGLTPIILPQAAQAYMPVSESGSNAGCSFPPGMVLRGLGGQEQWRIEGNNPYTRRHYTSALLTYLHTSGQPNHQELSSVNSINTTSEGAVMTIPEGIAFVDKGNGAEYLRQNGEWHHVPWPDMNTCLGIAPWQIVQVPSEAVVALPQGSQATCTYTNRIIYGPNGAQYYVTTQGKRQYIGTTAISACIGVRRGAGAPSQVSSATVDSYPLDSTLAYCNYEQELGLNFVREYGDPTVWLVHPNGTKEHVGSFCVNDDPNFTPLKRFHLFVVPPGETAGHVNTGVFWANGAICDQLPGAGLIWHA